MSRELQIGSNTFLYPEQGDKKGWGEDATEWAEAVTDALANVQGANDILITTASLNNNQTSPQNISGLLFNTGEVQSVMIDFFIIREYDSGSLTTVESGQIIGDYDGSTFRISTESNGNTGVTITVNSSGQFQYTSSNLTDHVSSVIRFRAKTIDTP